MKDILSSRGAFSSRKISALNEDSDDATNSAVWTTEKINVILDKIENEGLDIKGIRNSPFKDNDINLKRANLAFEYTPDEWKELIRCKNDILYFAENYCYIKAGEIRRLIKDAGGLRDFQKQILLAFQNNKLNILMASRQTGKSVTSAIFILWFNLFHQDRTTLVVADNFTTTRELLDIIKISLEGLPFFMKPGIKLINAGNIKFDNDSRIVARTTTKKSGIGLAVNLLYIDEFAHIDQAKLDEFYRAIFPTITRDPNAKAIITSTPNGKNKFYEMWVDAVNKKSQYVALRVDYWQIPNQDETFKANAIANLGSEEAFNQEYGLQFFSSDDLLLSSSDLKRLHFIKVDYEKSNFDLPEDRAYINDHFLLHPKYAKRSIHDFKNDKSNYVFSIDTAEGVGGDYSVLSVYKIAALPVAEVVKRKDAVKNELDAISLVQVATFRTNDLDIAQFAAAVEYITYNIFNPERVRIVLEMNYKGEMIHNRMADHPDYWMMQFIHTKHTELASNPKLGIRLGPTNKEKYCEQFKFLISTKRIIPNEFMTIEEISGFGRSKGGNYRGQNGNDDLAMTAINLAPFFESQQFWDLAIDTYENTPDEYRKELKEKVFDVYSNGNGKSKFDFDEIRRMNQSSVTGPTDMVVTPNVFDLKSYDYMRRLRDRFFND